MLTRHVLILIYINRLHPRCIDGLSNRSDPCGNSMAAHTVFSGVIVDPSESLCQLRAAAALDGDTANDEASRLRWRLRRLNGPPATNIYNLTRRSGRHNTPLISHVRCMKRWLAVVALVQAGDKVETGIHATSPFLSLSTRGSFP